VVTGGQKGDRVKVLRGSLNQTHAVWQSNLEQVAHAGSEKGQSLTFDR